MAILEVGSSHSKCLSCKRPADPGETGHYTLLGYGPDNGSPGCREEWTSVSLPYFRGTPESLGFWFNNLSGLPVEGERINYPTYDPEYFERTSQGTRWRGKIRCRFCKSTGWPLGRKTWPEWWGHRHGYYCKKRVKDERG